MALTWKLETPFFNCHCKTLEGAAIIQGLALIMTAGVWDQDIHRFLMLGCIAYWIAVFFIMVRRENRMTKSDRVLMDCGFIPLVITVVIYFFGGYAHL